MVAPESLKTMVESRSAYQLLHMAPAASSIGKKKVALLRRTSLVENQFKKDEENGLR